MTYPFLFYIKRVTKRGYNTKETSTEMAKLSSQFAAISPGMDTETAQEGLVSIMKAFDIDVVDVESKVIDKINVLGNNFAEENQDIVEGLKRSSAAMAAMGQSFEDTAALFTGGMEILQDAEVMGTALRSVAMRIRGYDEETEELSDSLKNVKGEVVDLTKTASKPSGITIFADDAQTKYKSMVQYLGEISDIWDELSEKQQTELLEKLFGKTRAQAGAAILKNFGQVRAALEAMEDSAGSADKEMETVQSSIDYKLNELKQTWVGIVQDMADRGDIQKIIDALIELSEAIGFVSDKLGTIGTIGLGVGIFAGFKNIDNIKSSIMSITSVLSAMSKIASNAYIGSDGLFDNKSLLSYVDSLSGLSRAETEVAIASSGLSLAQRKQVLSAISATAATKALTLEQIENKIASQLNNAEEAKSITQKLVKANVLSAESVATKVLTKEIIEQAVSTGALTASEANAIISSLGLTGANSGLTVSFKALTTSIWGSVKALGTFLITNPVGWAILAGGAIFGLVKIFDYFNTSTEEAKEKTNEYVNTLSSISSEVKTVEDKIKSLNEQIEGLDPITNSDDIENLKAESKELENQLAILKEKERLASVEANNAAKDSLSRTQASRYKSDKFESYNVDPVTGERVTQEFAVDVTRMEELQLAMDTYDELAKQKAELEAELAEMAKSQNYTQEDWDALETEINILDTKMQEARTHASELAVELNEEKNGLNGADESSKQLLDSTNSVLTSYKEWTDEVNSSTDALKNNTEAAKEVVKETHNILDNSATITSSIQQIATQLEPQFAKLGDAYKSIFTSDGFTLDNVDNSMLEDLRTTFTKIGEEIGVTFDSDQLEPFFNSLTDGTATSEQVQQAFNDLATSYFYSTDTLDKLNDTTVEAIQKQLEELGVVNAKEVVYDTLSVKTEALSLQEQFLAENGYALSEATEMKALMFLNEAGASETARQYLFQLVATEQIFNNQDLNAKQKIEELERLAIAYGQTAIAAKIANMEKAAEAGHTQIDYDKELVSLQAHLNDAMSQVKVDFKQIDTNAGKAGKDAAEEYKEALEKELSDLDTVLNFITDTIQDQIDAWNDMKDAAVDALETERDAAVEALEAQKEATQAKIDAKQDEIDKIKEAREERQAEIDLQKKQYDLERLQNQSTQLVYKDGQMVYTRDESAVREAREQVDEAKENIKILQIEKEISNLEDVIDSLDKQIDSVNDHFDKLIAQTEAYYDNLIKGMEEYKSRWEEISEIEEQAKINVLLEELGITTDDVLNMSGEAFEQFKKRYLDILTEMHKGESDMVSAINDVANGIDTEKLSEGLGKTKENIDKLTTTDYSTVVNGVSGISSALNEIPSSEKYDSLTNSFNLLAEAIQKVANALGITGDESVSGLIGALQTLGEFKFGEVEGGVIAQFTALKDAVDSVTTAINGGGSMANEGGGLATGANGGAATPTESGGGSGLTSAIKEIRTATDETIGSGGESSKEGGEGESSGEGVIGKFSEFKSAVDDVIKTIGTGEEDEEGSISLISAINTHHEVVETTIPLVIDWFDKLLQKITECVNKAKELSTTVQSLDHNMMGTVPITHAKGTVGNAFAKGYNGLPHREKNALRSEYGQPELTVYPNGTTELTTKPTMSDLPKDTVIFNEEQTRRIMNGKGTILGKSFASGTYSPVSSIQGIDIKSLQDKFLGKFDNIIAPVNSIDKNIESMVRVGNNIHTNHASQDINISIGDIQLHGVQDVNGLANAISTKLPNMLLQTITKR